MTSKALAAPGAALAFLFGLAVANPAGADVFDCGDCPQRITDAGALQTTPALVESEVIVPAGVCGGQSPSGGTSVLVDILHSHVGDLRVRLLAPGGAAYILVNRLGDGGGAGSCAGDDIRATFSQDPTQVAPVCTGQIPTVGPGAKSVTSLATIAGPVAAGTWTLEIGDHAEGGDGALVDWRMQFHCEGDVLGNLFKDGFED